MQIKFLGTHNAESKNKRMVTFVIDDVLAIDAGCLASELTFTEQAKIDTILLSHGHYDHIRGVPALVFNNPDRTTRVLGTAQTLEILSSHLVDGVIYPDFTSRKSYLGQATLELVTLQPFKPCRIDGYEITAIPVNHPLKGAGLLVTKNGKQIFYTGDTGSGFSDTWDKMAPNLIIAETTFPNKLESAAIKSGHLCPRFLAQELSDFKKVKGYLPEVKLVHVSPQYEAQIKRQVKKLALELGASISVAREGEKFAL